MPLDFVHLHVHSQFSFLTSSVRLGELPKRVKQMSMPAVALTDRANMFGAIRHYKACKNEGIVPIIGCEINVLRDVQGGAFDHLVVLAKDIDGYRNLVRLVSMGHLESAVEGNAVVTLDTIAQYSQGLLALSGCLGGLVAQKMLLGGLEHGEPLLGRIQEIFGPRNVFVELQDHGLPEQAIVNGELERIARKLNLQLVATNDVHFMSPDDGEAQLYLDCVRQNRSYADVRPHHHGSFEMYLKSPEEMHHLFRHNEEALRSTLQVAEMCSGLQLSLGLPLLPEFPVPPPFDVTTYFRHVAEEGLARRLADFKTSGKTVDESAYIKRLSIELDVIESMQFSGYFLIVWDFIREAKQRGIPVGPGRGSGAGSLVAYSMGITELDPIPYSLLFERFLNPERVSMPDFDIDFCMDRRGEVIDYVSSRYGARSVGQIATFQNLKARSVIKDVGRAMGFAPSDAQRIAALVPEKGQGKMCTIAEALEVEPKLKVAGDADPRIKELLAQAQKLEGLTRHAGMHAAGIVISDGPLYDHVPCFSSDGAIVTQYDKDDVEAAGLVKFDFLGLKTLTVINIAQRLVNARPDRQHDPIDLTRIALDDRETYQLIASGETTGVFQLESSGMQQMLRGLKPDCFEDIVAAVALYRPGPLGTGMIDDFIKSKHGRQTIRQLHPLVDEVLAPTYGVIVYQEQVMQIAQKLAGFTLGGADLLRRAMGKKKQEEMTKQQSAFIDGAAAKGVDPNQASAIFKEVEGFAAYGFNKSHSAAYALITYQTAFLKTHYPTEFFAAAMTADKDKIEKVVRTIAEARAWGVVVLPPDINASELDFTVVYDHPLGNGPRRGPGRLRDRHSPRIRFGLGAVRGVGQSALEGVFESREKGGRFADFFDFAARVDSRRLNKGLLDALVQCGAFDTVAAPMGLTRARLFAAIDRALERSRNSTRDRERGQTSLFSMLGSESSSAEKASFSDQYPDALNWNRLETLAREKASLGCYVTGHPLDRYGQKLHRLDTSSTKDLANFEPWTVARVAGMVENYQEKLFRGSGSKAAFFALEDLFGRVNAKIRGDRIEECVSLLKGGDPVIVTGKVTFPQTEDEEGDSEPTLLVDSVEHLGAAVQRVTRTLTVSLVSTATDKDTWHRLSELVRSFPGDCDLEFVVTLDNGVDVALGLDSWRVSADDGLLGALEQVVGYSAIELR
jgi:DNA polymerase III subunit alpha